MLYIEVLLGALNEYLFLIKKYNLKAPGRARPKIFNFWYNVLDQIIYWWYNVKKKQGWGDKNAFGKIHNKEF